MEKHICGKCNRQIQKPDLVLCPDCEKEYHSWCWNRTKDCVNCGNANISYRDPVIVTEKPKVDEPQFEVQNSDGMFANIGEKIEGVATFSTIVGIIIGIIIFIVMIFMGSFLLGLVIGGMVALISWVSSFLLYGFGALISSSQNTERLLIEVLKEIKTGESPLQKSSVTLNAVKGLV